MHLSLEDYFRINYEDKILIKMPEKENDHLTAATRLLEKRREMNEIDQALNSQKEEFHMKMESLTQRRKELERKENQLRESLLKFEKFLLENDVKKNRALKKAFEEKNNRRHKEFEVTKLNNEIEFRLKIKTKLTEKLNKYIIFQKYLEQVTEASEDFSEIREIIDRYETLTSTFQDLIIRDKNDFDLIEKQKQNLSDGRELKNQTVLQYNIKLAQLQNILDKSRSLTLERDAEWTNIIRTAADKALACGKIRMASYNLFQIAKKYQKHMTETVPYHDIEGQLIEICRFIEDLTYIQSRANDSIEDIAKDF